ncbi:hypothetical protein V6N11_024176 [Hibiscus sabdariffa]|uniref:Uncharacterized protein n=1 Tax=Hibiscus sabdariffa TaxID=183260 RepID=A0ABR1ZA35_9ROSI
MTASQEQRTRPVSKRTHQNTVPNSTDHQSLWKGRVWQYKSMQINAAIYTDRMVDGEAFEGKCMRVAL